MHCCLQTTPFQENVGGTTYFYTQEDLNAQQPGVVSLHFKEKSANLQQHFPFPCATIKTCSFAWAKAVSNTNNCLLFSSVHPNHFIIMCAANWCNLAFQLQVMPNFTMYPNILPHVAHMKPKPNSPSFFMPDEIKVVSINCPAAEDILGKINKSLWSILFPGALTEHQRVSICLFCL